MSDAKDAKKDYLGMSDEEFLNLNTPTNEENNENQEASSGSNDSDDVDNSGDSDPAAKAGSEDGHSNKEDVEDKSATAKSEEENEEDQGPVGSDDSKDAEASDADTDANADKDDDPDGSGNKGKTDSEAKDAKASEEADKAAKKDGDKSDGKAVASDDAKKKEGADDKDAEGSKPVNYEEFYKQVMTPFKANGRMIHLRTPEEAIRLMQMGAGYGRKIQDLQPHLKVLRMLEKNDLLDESKLSFLIDINQKNPDAIKKIIKDAGIDPIDLNIEDNTSYTPKNHSVSDEEMRFQDALSDVQGQENGNETLGIINRTWDQESKKLLWEQPEILRLIHQQRDMGIYDQITAEIERQKLLGNIPPSTPFLAAYEAVGKYLTETNALRPPEGQAQHNQEQSGLSQQKQVIATKTAAPKAQVQNSDKAAAAAAPKSTSRKAATTVNPLAMADDEFLKQFEGRI